MLGKELSDGTDYIELTAELFEWIDKRKFDLDWGNGSIIEIITSGKNAWSTDCIKIPDNLSNAFAWSIVTENSATFEKGLFPTFLNCSLGCRPQKGEVINIISCQSIPFLVLRPRMLSHPKSLHLETRPQGSCLLCLYQPRGIR
jgi:hypothetical protein